MRLSEKKNPALVLSGGGIKAAAFHIGVCLALREKGFRFGGGYPDKFNQDEDASKLTFKTYVGSSAGAMVCTLFAAGYDIDSIINAFTKGAGLGTFRKPAKSTVKLKPLKPLSYRNLFALNVGRGTPSKLLNSMFKKRPVIAGGLEVLLKRGMKVNGLFSTRGIEKYLREHVLEDNHFKALAVNLYIVATQLNHSRKVIFGPFDKTTADERIMYSAYSKISEAVAASVSLPPLFTPFPITDDQGREIYFFDGEIRDTLSTHVAADAGCDLVIASYSIQPYHYNEEMGSLHEYGMPIISNQALYQVVQQKIDTHIRHQKQVGAMISAVGGYLKQMEISDKDREKLLEILYEKTNHKPNVEHIYIRPSPHDYKMFFADHFSLNPEILNHIVRTGFRSAMEALRPYNV